jgi:hypothetical protein
MHKTRTAPQLAGEIGVLEETAEIWADCLVTLTMLTRDESGAYRLTKPAPEVTDDR